MKHCKFCGVEFEPANPKGEFCKASHRVEWHRKQARGGAGQPPTPKTPPKPKDAPPPASVAKKAPVAPAPIAGEQPTPAPRRKVRIWPAGMPHEEVVARLYRIRDYNVTMRRQGTPQNCSTPAQIMERLEEVEADRKLLKIAFP